jgi:predicted RNase H-like HicB family nuclease
MSNLPVDHRIEGEWRMKIKVYLEESEDGGYTAIVPSLPGCISEGDTREEALENIREAIELYLEPVEDDVLSLGLSEEVELAI